MEEINIKEYFHYLKHYILAFIIAIALMVGGILAYDIVVKKPIYQATTSVVIAKSDNSEGSAATISEMSASQKLTNTYSEIAKSELVLNRVVDELKLPMTAKELSRSVSVKPVENTLIINISVKDQDAARSATIANGIAKVFAEEITTKFKLDNVSQLSVATSPNAPSNNTLTRDIVLAAIIAVVGVASFAFLRFYLDDTVKHTDDIEKMIGLPVAGSISRNDSKIKNGNELLVARAPKSIVSENIKSLRTNLQFTAVDRNLKTILVTSTNAGEGKSFVSANLAISFAQAGKKVLIIDCDLRKGRLNKLFKMFNNAGLSDLLADNVKNMSSYIRKTSVDNLDLITCGTYPPNPSELLASQRNRKVLSSLRSHYDIIVLDGAPIGGLADSVILSSLADEVLIVTRDGATSKSDLLATRDALRRVEANIAGIVFNAVNHRSTKYYYYSEAEKK